MNKRRTLVLDTSAFIAGFDPSSIDDEQYSVPTVWKELAKNSLPWIRFNAAFEGGRLKVLEPDSWFLDFVKECAKQVGDLRYLSRADMEILALAIQLKRKGRTIFIVTDDYSIQNVARRIGVSFASLATFGIRFQFNWLLYCPACHKKYPPDYKFDHCEICGTKLRRKPLKKRK